MMERKTLTVALMDPPYESERSTTALRIIDAALRKGHRVRVFAYEGAVNLTMRAQQPHANPAKGTTIEEERHPTTKDWIAALLRMAQGEQTLEWINCGLCVDERGAGQWIEGPTRGGPKDFLDWVATSDAVLVIPTK